MTRTFFGLLTVLALTLVPGEAFAQKGFIRWIERLSGPGPFKGPAVDVMFLCYGKELMTPTSDREKNPEAGRTWFPDLGCANSKREPNDARYSLGVDFGFLGTDQNPLVYGRALSEEEQEVDLFYLMPKMDISADHWLDVGVGAGYFQFSSDRDIFPTFRKFALAGHITVKPLTVFGRDYRKRFLLEFLQLRLPLTYMAGATLEDFGAIGGELPDHEFFFRPYVLIDGMSLIYLFH